MKSSQSKWEMFLSLLTFSLTLRMTVSRSAGTSEGIKYKIWIYRRYSNSALDATFWRAHGKADLTRMLENVKYEGIARNVIIFVGDGMGIQTHTMARIYKVDLFTLQINDKATEPFFFFFIFLFLFLFKLMARALTRPGNFFHQPPPTTSNSHHYRVSWKAGQVRRASWYGRPSLTQD